MLANQSSGVLLLDTNLLLLLFIGGKGTSLIKKAKTLSAYTEADLPLYIHCSNSGLNVANFNHVRQVYWG